MKRYAVLAVVVFCSPARGHQPVMDMAPRWAGGYGAQIRFESEQRKKLELDGNAAANPNGLVSRTQTQWYEGVYTYSRGLRVTFKLPQISKSERIVVNGTPRTLRASGLGDLILGVPLKYYFNKEGYTGNYSLTPSLFLPTGSTSSELPLGRGTVDYGLSAAASVELFRFYTFFDLFTRLNTRGSDGTRLGNTLGFDVDLGVHPYHDNATNSGIFIMTGLNGRRRGKDVLSDSSRDADTGGAYFEVVPTIVFYWNNWMWRTQYHIPVHQRLNGTQLASSYKIQSGLGVTFMSLNPF